MLIHSPRKATSISGRYMERARTNHKRSAVREIFLHFLQIDALDSAQVDSAHALRNAAHGRAANRTEAVRVLAFSKVIRSRLIHGALRELETILGNKTASKRESCNRPHIETKGADVHEHISPLSTDAAVANVHLQDRRVVELEFELVTMTSTLVLFDLAAVGPSGKFYFRLRSRRGIGRHDSDDCDWDYA